MAPSNKKVLFALAILGQSEVSAFAIPSFTTTHARAAPQPGTACKESTIVVSGDSCKSLAERCSISRNELIQLNPGKDLCANIASYETICCGKTIEPRSSATQNDRPESDQSDRQADGQEADQGDDENGYDDVGQTVDATDEQEQDGNDNQDNENNNDNQDNESNNDNESSNEGSNEGETGDESGDDPAGDETGDNQTADGGNGQENNEKDDDTGDRTNGNVGKDGDEDGGDGQNGNKNDGNNNPKNGTTIENAEPRYILPGPRTGNWTKLHCDDIGIDPTLPPEQRWSLLGAPDAFQNAVDQFTQQDRDKNKTLLDSIFTTFGESSVDCSNIMDGQCTTLVHCEDFSVNRTGPAAMLIHNSFSNIHKMFSTTHSALLAAKIDTSFGLDSFIDTFAPIQPPTNDLQWMGFFLEIITMGATAGFSKIIGSAFAALPALKAVGKSDAAKGVTETLFGGAIDELKGLNENKKMDGFDLTQQHDLKATFGEVYKAWAKMLSDTLTRIFKSDNDSIGRLGNLINGGKMLGGDKSASMGADFNTVEQFTGMMFSVAAPLAWRLSKSLVFIVDTGAKCDDMNIKGVRLDQKDFQKLSACVDEKLYYLAMVPDKAPKNCPVNGGSGQICTHNAGCPPQHCPDNNFEKPPGADALDGSRAEFGYINATDIITGSVRTYKANGSKNNNAKPVEYTNPDAIMSIADPASYPLPGMFRLPVCSPAAASDAWANKPRTAHNFPCFEDPVIQAVLATSPSGGLVEGILGLHLT